jgi:hypothetical protein
MNAYIFLIVLLITALIYSGIGKKRKSKTIINTITLIIIIMQGLRHFDVGIDLTMNRASKKYI